MPEREVRHDMDSKVALVLGGGSGMGRETAIAFAYRGARVAIGDIDESGAQETAATIAEMGGHAFGMSADVREKGDNDSLVQAAVSNYGALDYAVNTAGITGPAATVLDYLTEDWDDVFSVNLRGMYFAMQSQLRQMMAQGRGGAIVNISSAVGLIAAGDYPAYTASKHGVIGLTRSAAIAFAKKNIRINCICPGSVRTPMWERTAEANPSQIEEWLQAHPIGRVAEAHEVADVLVWLCSSESSFVTGVALPVDGGMTIW